MAVLRSIRTAGLWLAVGLLAGSLIGCSSGGGGNVIEPSQKGGSPIVNKTPPKTPGNTP